MKILFIGDIVGRPGRETVKALLPEMKKQEKYDLVIANGENLSHGKGLTEDTAAEMMSAGIDFFTSGNHIWRDKKIYSKLDDPSFPAIRPANYPPGAPGKGYKIFSTSLLKQILIINLMGRVFFRENLDCPFRVFDQIMAETKYLNPAAIFIDFHAEATSEKIAFVQYVDGRVAAVVGTHTHVPTADLRIMPKGTAAITDVGMTGLKDGVIGVDKEGVLKHFLTQLPATHEIGTGETVFNAVEIEVEEGRAVGVKQIIKELSNN